MRHPSRIMSSTPRFSSSSLIRTDSPLSPRMSLTVMMARASIRFTAAIVYIIAASISTPTCPRRFQRANVVGSGS
jgi:hypothetical protein